MADADPKARAEAQAAIEERFWKTIRSDRTAMLGLDHETGPRPMTAQLEGEENRGPFWFFGGMDNELTQRLSGETQAYMTFVSKNHEIWASVDGTLALHNDRAMIDKLWNPFVAAWYPNGGKDDPNLALLRFTPTDAKIWHNTGGLFDMVKGWLGLDPKEGAEQKVAEVKL